MRTADGYMKVGHKARSGRRANPVPHKSHHKAPAYSRAARLLKQRVALMLAPKTSDWVLDRPRLGEYQERAARDELAPDRRFVSVMAGTARSSREATR